MIDMMIMVIMVAIMIMKMMIPILSLCKFLEISIIIYEIID